MSQHADHRPLVNRAKRIEGQVRGIVKMIEDQSYCVDILTQIKAASRALNSLKSEILEGHMRHCMIQAATDQQGIAEEKIKELLELLKKDL
jgi:DNA-binding FrmR family transcriptional regulator